MMSKNPLTIPACRYARLALVLVWGGLAVAAIAAPLFAARADSFLAGTLYLLLSRACHQIPGRSFRFFGYPWAACHRCSGIYLGLLAAAMFSPGDPSALASHIRRRTWVALATLPLLTDALLPLTGIWANTPVSRFVTGFTFGAMLSSLLVPGVSELLARCLRRGLRPYAHNSYGDHA